MNDDKHEEKCNDAPGKSIVPNSNINDPMRPRYSYRRKLTETTNALEQSRTPPINISLAETPAQHYPRCGGKTSDGRNRKTPKILKHAIFTV